MRWCADIDWLLEALVRSTQRPLPVCQEQTIFSKVECHTLVLSQCRNRLSAHLYPGNHSKLPDENSSQHPLAASFQANNYLLLHLKAERAHVCACVTPL
ncbi:hypothetical protein BaRGS_00003139 [Batillaria attramentaria]|uniref:Uncharacterized protein n=1 Tax=Batillaria attramentaria TaxID=370345 RepID=A0ABD0M2F2_9CAEN